MFLKSGGQLDPFLKGKKIVIWHFILLITFIVAVFIKQNLNIQFVTLGYMYILNLALYYILTPISKFIRFKNTVPVLNPKAHACIAGRVASTK